MNTKFDTSLTSYEMTPERLDRLCKKINNISDFDERLNYLSKLVAAYEKDYLKQKPQYKLHCGEFKTGIILYDIAPVLLDIYCKTFAKSCLDDMGFEFFLNKRHVRDHVAYINSNRLRMARFEAYLSRNNLPKPLYYLDFFTRAYTTEHILAKQWFDQERPEWYDNEDVLRKLQYINQVMDYQKEIINEQMVYTTPF